MATTLGPTSHVVASIHDEGLVLFDTVEGSFYASNQIGARIWQALERGLPTEAIAADISHRYGLPHDRASAHVSRFLADLTRQRLVVVQ